MGSRAAEASSPSPTGASPEVAPAELSPEKRFLKAYRSIILARHLEEKLTSLYHAGKIVGGVYVGRGQESFSAALTVHLDSSRDVYGPLIRDQAGRLAFGEPFLDAPRTYFGSVAGPMRGRDGNVHRGRPTEGMPAMISHLGSLPSVIGGMLLAKRFKGETGFVGAASIGDGATSTGAVHEAMNLAGIERLPMVIAVANNRYAYSTPVSRQYACSDLVERAPGYGFSGHSVDGTDLDACLEVFGHAVEAARAGKGPQMVVGSLLRLSGHGEHDDASYISEEDRRAPFGRDCLAVARAQAIAHAYADEATLEGWDREATAEVEKGIATAQKEPGPDPYGETWQTLATSHLNEGIYDQG